MYHRILYLSIHKYLLCYRKEVTECSHNLRKLAMEQFHLPTSKIVAKPLEGLSTCSRPSAPSDEALKQRVRRIKGKVLPKVIPTTRTEIQIPEMFIYSIRNEPFLLHDDGNESNDRTIVFATQANLKVSIWLIFKYLFPMHSI